MKYLPEVTRAVYTGGFRIRLTFDDGLIGTVDFKQFLHGPVFEPLKEVEFFKGFFLAGGSVAWSNGADIAPETLYEEARKNAAA